MTNQLLAVTAALATLGFVAELLRRGILQERFAALWLLVSSTLLILALFPKLVVEGAGALGFALPANLLFFLAIIFLLLVAVQLSFEVAKLEGRTRRLAEDLALLTWEVRPGPGAQGDPTLGEEQDPASMSSAEAVPQGPGQPAELAARSQDRVAAGATSAEPG